MVDLDNYFDIGDVVDVFYVFESFVIGFEEFVVSVVNVCWKIIYCCVVRIEEDSFFYCGVVDY